MVEEDKPSEQIDQLDDQTKKLFLTWSQLVDTDEETQTLILGLLESSDDSNLTVDQINLINAVKNDSLADDEGSVIPMPAVSGAVEKTIDRQNAAKIKMLNLLKGSDDPNLTIPNNFRTDQMLVVPGNLEENIDIQLFARYYKEYQNSKKSDNRSPDN